MDRANAKYQGVRGWLVLFIAGVFLAPVINLLSQHMVSAALKPFGQWKGVSMYLTLRFLLLMAFSIYGIYCGVALLRKDRLAVTHAKAFC